MKIHTLPQGSAAWHQLRAKHFCASEAASVMGVSKFKSRSELLKEKATGLAEEVDAATQRRFDAGHAAEVAARELAEEVLGEELYPCVGTLEVDGLPLLASFDGINMNGDIVWETKLYNQDLAEAVDRAALPPHFWAQLEQQLLVSGAEKAYFTTSDGTKDKTVGMWYVSMPERRAQLMAALKQFKADLDAYRHEPEVIKPTAAPIKDLPAPVIRVDGNLALISNLEIFGENLTKFLADVNRKPDDDQGFADAEAVVKTLRKAEDALKAAETEALSRVTSIDDMRRTVANLHEMARGARLELERIVKAQKEKVKVDAVNAAKARIEAHIRLLNDGLGGLYIQGHAADFADAIRGLKTVKTMNSAIGDEVAKAMIDINNRAENVKINLVAIKKHGDYQHLFPDLVQVATKTPEDFAALVSHRVAECKARDAERIEAERQRIRKEEEARAESERQRLAKEETRKAEAAVKSVASPTLTSVQVAIQKTEEPEESITSLIDMLPSWDDNNWLEKPHQVRITVDYVKVKLKALLADGAVKI